MPDLVREPRPSQGLSCRDCGGPAEVGNPLYPTAAHVSGRFVHLRCPSFVKPPYRYRSVFDLAPSTS